MTLFIDEGFIWWMVIIFFPPIIAKIAFKYYLCRLGEKK